MKIVIHLNFTLSVKDKSCYYVYCDGVSVESPQKSLCEALHPRVV